MAGIFSALSKGVDPQAKANADYMAAVLADVIEAAVLRALNERDAHRDNRVIS